MRLADIAPFECCVLAKIGSDNWKNRVSTFAVPGTDNVVEARGSLKHFISENDKFCLITYGCFDQSISHSPPIVDIGFHPSEECSNDISKASVWIERNDGSEVNSQLSRELRQFRDEYFLRRSVTHLLGNLRVTTTHPECRRGSAEIPKDIMEFAGLQKFSAVTVYNASHGGAAETYVVPMDSGVVMTTGAMAQFAPVGSVANLCAYSISNKQKCPKIVHFSDNSPSSASSVMFEDFSIFPEFDN